MTTRELFRTLTDRLSSDQSEIVPRSFVLAELNDLLTSADADAIAALPLPELADPYLANYVTAMVELAAHIKGVDPPAWAASIEPLAHPVFGVPWMSLRAHLLLESPVPFRRRNIFINASIGARV